MYNITEYRDRTLFLQAYDAKKKIIITLEVTKCRSQISK